jgi:hypothetical protein
MRWVCGRARRREAPSRSRAPFHRNGQEYSLLQVPPLHRWQRYSGHPVTVWPGMAHRCTTVLSSTRLPSGVWQEPDGLTAAVVWIWEACGVGPCTCAQAATATIAAHMPRAAPNFKHRIENMAHLQRAVSSSVPPNWNMLLPPKRASRIHSERTKKKARLPAGRSMLG